MTVSTTVHPADIPGRSRKKNAINRGLNSHTVPLQKMGSAPYIGPRLGGGAIFKVPLLPLHAKERPCKYLLNLC